MAGRFKPVATWPGAVAAAFVLFLILGTLCAVALRADGSARLGPGDWAAIRFTLTQAALSALISVGLAIPVARALARRQFPGRGLLVTLLGAPFILPVIVAVLGLLAIFGRNGVLSGLFDIVGLPPVSIYGLHGVVLAHVFFNLPLATRLILQGWLTIPTERFRLASSLGFTPMARLRHVEWPMLRTVLPGAFLVVFLICTTSFAVALTLGGGPRATTIELAIYQAFRFDFDLGKAAFLGLIQIGIGGSAALLAFWVTGRGVANPGLDRAAVPGFAIAGMGRLLDALFIALAALFLLAPLSAIILNGIPNLLDLPGSVFTALGRSILVALCSAALTLCLALSIALWSQFLRSGAAIAANSIGVMSVVASPLVIGTGLFILLFPYVNPTSLALPITALVNALMALPFALRSIAPALAQSEADFGRLATSLRLTGWARMRVLILPRLRRPIGFAAGLSAALSMGDLGVVALFADADRATLPLQLYRLMARYRMEDAAGAALLLLVASLLLFWIFDRGARLNART